MPKKKCPGKGDMKAETVAVKGYSYKRGSKTIKVKAYCRSPAAKKRKTKTVTKTKGGGKHTRFL